MSPHHKPTEGDGDTKLIAKGAVAMLHKFLDSKIIWRLFASAALSFIAVEKEIPSKVTVESSPTADVYQVKQADFQNLMTNVAAIESTVNFLRQDDAETKKSLDGVKLELSFLRGQYSSRRGP